MKWINTHFILGFTPWNKRVTFRAFSFFKHPLMCKHIHVSYGDVFFLIFYFVWSNWLCTWAYFAFAKKKTIQINYEWTKFSIFQINVLKCGSGGLVAKSVGYSIGDRQYESSYTLNKHFTYNLSPIHRDRRSPIGQPSRVHYTL